MHSCFRHVHFFVTHGLQSTRLFCPWDSPGKNTGVGCHFLLSGIFQTQGSNLSLLHWQADSLPLSHQGCLYEVYLELNSSVRALVMCFSLFTNSVELNKALPEKLLATSKTEARMPNCFNWDSMSCSRILSISRVW